MIYSGRGKESGLDVYELDEPVLFFSALFLFCHFNHFPSSSVPALGCQSIKANASRKGGEMINILRKQLSQPDSQTDRQSGGGDDVRDGTKTHTDEN